MINKNKMDQTGVNELTTAIVVRAVKDIKFLLKKIEKEKNPEKKEAMSSSLKELERFFYSDWFKAISEYDGPKLYQNILKKAA